MEKNASKQNVQYQKNIIPKITVVFPLYTINKSTRFTINSKETWILISAESLIRNFA